jgi:tetratricopeptide (TPR) repeat protein
MRVTGSGLRFGAALAAALFLGCATLQAAPLPADGQAGPFSIAPPGTLQLFPELKLPGQNGVAEEQRVSLKTAIAALARGDFDNATKMFQALHNAFPNAVAPYIGLAEVKARKGQFDAADALIGSGIAALPNSAELYRARARLYAGKGLEEGAIKAYEKAITLQPDNEPGRLEFADYLAQRSSDPGKALPIYQSAIARAPENGAAYYGLGFALSRLKRNTDAIAALDKAQKLAPHNPLPALAEAKLYLQQNDSTKAMAAFDRALRIRPDFVEARIGRAGLMLSLGRYRNALKDYDAALTAAPKSLDALLGKGMAHQALGQDGDAIATYRKVIAIAPNSPLALNNLAWLSAGKKADLDEALTWATRATTLAPKQADFRDTLGWVRYQRGELKEAEAAFKQAIALRPSAGSYTHLGMVYGDIGEKTEAAASFQKALKLNPKYKPAQQKLQALN